MEDYACTLIKEMIAKYKDKFENADKEERLIYSMIIDDLKGIITDLVHH